MKKKSLNKKFKTVKEMDDYLENTDLGKVFAEKGSVVRPSIQKINIDMPTSMLAKIDIIAEKIGISRQPLIKMWIHEKLKEEIDDKSAEKLLAKLRANKAPVLFDEDN